MSSYKAIVDTLLNEIENESDKDVNEAIGILTNMRKGQFIVYLFLLHTFLTIINILTCKLQEKSSTLGNSAVIIKSIIKSLEDYKTIECFAEIWLDINTFATVNNISIENPFQGNKRNRKEPNDLKNFIVTARTSAQYTEYYSK
ncbi:uncharacterized protein LOC112690205 [Sipha flava]|uniref:Uncharacterized protein LOC112690205 n=1 Tax=Sipha flava TaxID=143950 RepID=A0A8B8GB13_9HEMI|nr:uncharacterized protein LOC112690205 [Sipha flava]